MTQRQQPYKCKTKQNKTTKTHVRKSTKQNPKPSLLSKESLTLQESNQIYEKKN
jgi:hypothetical protein